MWAYHSALCIVHRALEHLSASATPSDSATGCKHTVDVKLEGSFIDTMSPQSELNNAAEGHDSQWASQILQGDAYLSSFTAASCFRAGKLGSVLRIFASMLAASAPVADSSTGSALPSFCPALSSAAARAPASAAWALSMCSMHSACLQNVLGVRLNSGPHATIPLA